MSWYDAMQYVAKYITIKTMTMFGIVLCHFDAMWDVDDEYMIMWSISMLHEVSCHIIT